MRGAVSNLYFTNDTSTSVYKTDWKGARGNERNIIFFVTERQKVEKNIHLEKSPSSWDSCFKEVGIFLGLVRFRDLSAFTVYNTPLHLENRDPISVWIVTWFLLVYLIEAKVFWKAVAIPHCITNIIHCNQFIYNKK